MEKEGTKNHPSLYKTERVFLNPALSGCPKGGAVGGKEGNKKPPTVIKLFKISQINFLRTCK
ncbi:MAG: hypothetical protein PHN75_15740 [Syntrophales bacterium]|nr:hypothetical protein [Syntrophales bacterium]